MATIRTLTALLCVVGSSTKAKHITYSLLPSGTAYQSFGDGARYSFSYQAPESFREEDADANLNVKGRYSFVAGDGQSRTINYKAGALTGFVAEGDVPGTADVPSAATPSRPSATVYSVSGKPGDSNLKSSVSPDGSYSFNFETPESSRAEEADSDLNVKGSYSFVAGDGQRRTINYKAGALTGFVVEGDVPGTPEVAAPASLTYETPSDTHDDVPETLVARSKALEDDEKCKANKSPSPPHK